MLEKLQLAQRVAEEANAAKLKAEMAQHHAEQKAMQNARLATDAEAKAEAAQKKNDVDVDELNSRFDCVICLDAPCNVVLGPCMHVCCCVDCGAGLDQCPQCRTPIQNQSRVYLP